MCRNEESVSLTWTINAYQHVGKQMTKNFNLPLAALLSLMLAAPLIALMYLTNQLLGLPFAPFDVFDWVARVLPGGVITFGIDVMIDTLLALGLSVVDLAKTSEHIMAVGIFLVAGVIGGVLVLFVITARDIDADWVNGLIAGLIVGSPVVAIHLAISGSQVSALIRLLWLSLLFAGWGVALMYMHRATMAQPKAEAKADEAMTVEQVDRRRFLITAGASTAAFTVVGSGVGLALSSAERRREEAELVSSDAHNEQTSGGDPFPNVDSPITPAPGTRPEYTPLKDHYQVFLRTEPSVIEAEGYILPITGMVDNPLMLTVEDLQTGFTNFDQFVTLSCISGRIGTELISTTQWTGFSAQELLDRLGVQDGAEWLVIRSEDGFYESVALEWIREDERIMFCHSWDGNPLPTGHGFPLRIWIPDRFGMKQPKWITSIEVTDEYQLGYWVERNWSEDAFVRTTSVIDTVAVNSVQGSGVPIGGIAWSGDRQISQVQVRVNGGDWEDAQLREPLSETTWVIWRYEWPFEEGEFTFEVKCFDGDGVEQVLETMTQRPDGATGIHSVEETVTADA